ncbi:metallophosphoesterase [Chlorella sorokiniana]|uniref:Vacuolar protein sorting-associated protein 29 n=1 Tax=Chlorella sorokiniana TaxID=3076 RepID=A0A2P6TSE3_CHLSO|nr:metallophosphoesterase [Chlorella sorokiniana]|eukprot:PRW56978.1 metallophosphoesterase [Chlorella sorokiniana]
MPCSVSKPLSVAAGDQQFALLKPPPPTRHSAPRHLQMLVGLVSDTHGVYDPALATHFAGADAILHAGDVGSHGGHEAVLARLREVCPAVHAVRGNVDDDAAAQRDLPESLLLTLAGWRVLLIHILADAAAAIQRHQPDIVLHGHSHQYSLEEVAAPQGGPLLHINPGSAGPARFKLKRTAALLRLPPKGHE